eukprot:1100314_1
MSFATTFQDHAQNHGPIYNLNFTSAQSSRDEKRNIDSFVRSGMKRGYFTPKSIEDILGAYLPSQVINEILTNLHRITSETHAEETLKSILHYVLSLNNARWKDMNRIMKRFKQSVAIATHSHNNRNRNQSPPQIGELDCDSDSEGVIEGDEVKPKLIRRTNVCKEHRHRKVAPANRSRDKYGFERGHNNHYMNHKRKQSEPRGPRPPLDQHRVHEHRHKHGSHDDKGLKREYKIRKSKKKPRTTCNSLPIPDFMEIRELDVFDEPKEPKEAQYPRLRLKKSQTSPASIDIEIEASTEDVIDIENIDMMGIETHKDEEIRRDNEHTGVVKVDIVIIVMRISG